MGNEEYSTSNLHNIFDEVKPFSKGFYAVRKGYKWGLIEMTVKFISVEDYKAQKKLTAIEICRNKKTGKLLTHINNLLVQQNIDLEKPCLVGIFSDYDCVLQSNNEGILILQCIYDWIWDIDDDMVSFRYKGEKSFIPIKLLKLFSSKYDFIYGFHHGFSIAKVKDKCGVITEEGEEIFPCIYDNLIYSEDRLFREYIGNNHTASECYNEKWIVIDKWTLKIDYDKYSKIIVLPNNFKKVLDLNGKWGMLDVYNRKLIPCIYDELEYKEQSKLKSLTIYDNVIFHNRGYFEAKIKDEYRIINIDNNITFSGKEKPIGFDLDAILKKTICKSEEDLSEYKNHFMGNNGYYYLGNGDNDWCITAVIDDYYERNHNIDATINESKEYKRVTENAMWGFSNAEGDVIIPIKYEQVARYSNGVFPVKIYGKWGFVNRKNQTIIPFKYDNISYNGFVDGLVAAKIKNKWGFIDVKGQTVIKFNFDSVTDFYMGICEAGNDSKDTYFSYYISKDSIDIKIEIIEKKHDYPSSKDEWTEYWEDLDRDTWDALTDGQYGDYPENGYDISDLLDSMGRG